MPIFPLYFSEKSLVKSNAKSAYLNVVQYNTPCLMSLYITDWGFASYDYLGIK